MEAAVGVPWEDRLPIRCFATQQAWSLLTSAVVQCRGCSALYASVVHCPVRMYSAVLWPCDMSCVGDLPSNARARAIRELQAAGRERVQQVFIRRTQSFPREKKEREKEGERDRPPNAPPVPLSGNAAGVLLLLPSGYPRGNFFFFFLSLSACEIAG